MKYAYSFLSVIVVLSVSHLWAYNAGYSKAQSKTYIKQQEEASVQLQAIQAASQKILDFQKKIANNNDECFNRVWDESVIESVNPQLR